MNDAIFLIEVNIVNLYCFHAMCDSGRMKLDELYDILFRENVKCVKIRPCYDDGPVFSLLRCVTDDNV